RIAEQITQDLVSFANYGFPESHAWSFALIAYATAWLKANHPTEFYLGMLNAWPMGFYPPATLVHDAMRHGVIVRPPCLAGGEWDCTLEVDEEAPSALSAVNAAKGRAQTTKSALRIGWRHIRGLGEKSRKALQQAHQD